MDDKAVSPIIATILLIAITVTLAASFYTVAVPYFTQSQEFTPQATIIMHSSSNLSGGKITSKYTMYVSNMPQPVYAGNVII
ncbi:MAG: archaellin/type IV pilin N-terminal domain-containing protein, partial [Thermoplasmata archaeon]